MKFYNAYNFKNAKRFMENSGIVEYIFWFLLIDYKMSGMNYEEI